MKYEFEVNKLQFKVLDGEWDIITCDGLVAILQPGEDEKLQVIFTARDGEGRRQIRQAVCRSTQEISISSLFLRGCAKIFEGKQVVSEYLFYFNSLERSERFKKSLKAFSDKKKRVKTEEYRVKTEDQQSLVHIAEHDVIEQDYEYYPESEPQSELNNELEGVHDHRSARTARGPESHFMYQYEFHWDHSLDPGPPRTQAEFVRSHFPDNHPILRLDLDLQQHYLLALLEDEEFMTRLGAELEKD